MTKGLDKQRPEADPHGELRPQGAITARPIGIILTGRRMYRLSNRGNRTFNRKSLEIVYTRRSKTNEVVRGRTMQELLRYELLVNLSIAGTLSLIVWSVLYQKQVALGLASTGGIELFTFLISMDLLFAYRRPALQISPVEMELSTHGAFYFFVIMAVLTWLMAILVFRLLAKAEAAIAATIRADDATFFSELRNLLMGRAASLSLWQNLKLKASWSWWMSVISGLRFALTSAHVGVLLVLPVGR